MTIAKIVRLRAAHGSLDDVDRALRDAAAVFAVEPGTVTWTAFPGPYDGERVLVEVFADRVATRAHDASDAVGTLLEQIHRLAVDVVSVEELTTEHESGTSCGGMK